MKHLPLYIVGLTVLLSSCGNQSVPKSGVVSSTPTNLQRPGDLAPAKTGIKSNNVTNVNDAWRGMTWRLLDTRDGIVHVGADQATDPYRGDTSAASDLPILCLEQDGRPSPEGLATNFYDGWASGQVKLTPPITGSALTSQRIADQVCAAEFGPQWRMAEFHDGQANGEPGGWRFYANGNINTDSRFWVAINDQNANPWNSDGVRTDTVIPDSTKVLSERDRAGLLQASEDGRTLLFRSDTPLLANLSAGMVVVSRPTDAAPGGLLGRVRAVLNNGETTTVLTEDVPLEEVIQDGDLDAEIALDSGAIDYSRSGSMIQAQQSRLQAQRTFKLFSFSKTPFCLYDHQNRDLDCDDGASTGLKGRVPSTNYATFDGNLNAQANAFINVKIRWFSLRHFDAGVELTESAKAILDAKGSYTWNVNKDLNQWKITFSPIVFFIGPVPVVITPILVPTVGTDGEITATLHYEVTQNFSGRYGTEYNKGNGWSGIKSHSSNFTQSPATANGTGRASAYVGVKGIMAFYSSSVNGPQVFAHAKPFAEVEAKASAVIGQGAQIEACGYYGVRADVGVAFPLITSSTWQARVLDLRDQIGCWGAGQPGPGNGGNAYNTMTLNFTSVQGDVEVNKYNPVTGTATRIGYLGGDGSVDILNALNATGDTIIQVSSIAKRSSGIFGNYRRNIDMAVSANGRTVYDPSPTGCTGCHSAQVYQFTVNKANGTLTW
jgi:hypothetical protein